jgi:predicted Ser/Thr protein kinase
MIGKVISHYRIVEKLGEGGMGVVYRAEDTKLGRPVALKFLSVQLLSEEEEIERFKAEARAASSINHPNICTIHDIDEVYGRWFIVMEYLEGETFAGLLRRKTLSLHETLGYAIQACEAFAAAHRRNIVHGDIKPSNLFLTADGRVKLLDFGLSKAWVLHVPEDDRTVKLERKDTVSGTLRYMSPEQARGWETDCRSDIFSFGVVLYEMLTGRRPFDGDTTTAILSAVIADEPVPVTVLRPELSEDLRRIIHKCLRKEPELRYQDTGELLAELKVQRRRLEFSQAVERTQHLAPAPPRGLESVGQEFGEEVREGVPEAAAVVEVESGEALAEPVYDVDSAAHAGAAAHEIAAVGLQKKRRSRFSRQRVLVGLIAIAILIVAAWGAGFLSIDRLWQRRSAPDAEKLSPRTAEQSPPTEEKPPPTQEKSPPTQEKLAPEKLTAEAIPWFWRWDKALIRNPGMVQRTKPTETSRLRWRWRVLWMPPSPENTR